MPTLPSHGTLTRYKCRGCRCADCRATHRAYTARRTRLKAYGRWQPYTDAEPVRTHLRRLSARGVGYARAARLAGLAPATAGKILYGVPSRGAAPSRRVRPATATALLAVEPALDALADGTPVDAAGTRRRVQALVAIGWSQAKLATRLGVQPSNFTDLLRRHTVRAATARAAAALFDELWDTPPPETGHRDKIAANRARSRARTQGWPPPAGWDDDLIDLPEAELETELARRVAVMDNDELARAWTARFKHGDRSPLITAAALEHSRRKKRRHRRAKANA